jgi:hypothetical protein
VLAREDHPPTGVESWRRIIRICKAHGLNHIRFHSWCPPEAAFLAADELGFYFQVEASSWANRGTRIGSGDPLDAWLEAESRRMLVAYGNHPSFLMMAYGNEPGGPNHVKWLEGGAERRRIPGLYTTGAGWPVRPGSDFHSSAKPRIQARGPEIDHQLPTAAHGLRLVGIREPCRCTGRSTRSDGVVYRTRQIPKYSGYFQSAELRFQRPPDGAARHHRFPAGIRQLQVAYKHDIRQQRPACGFSC